MPVPVSIDDLSTTPGSNSPAGSESPTDGDNYIRTYGSFIAILRDKLDGSSSTGTITTPTFVGDPAGTLLPSTYTPTPTGVTNFSSPSAGVHIYTRIGGNVRVAGTVSGNTSAGGLATFRVTLPVGSDFVATVNCTGVATGNSGAVCAAGFVIADATNDAAEVTFQASSSAAWTVYYEFTYRIL